MDFKFRKRVKIKPNIIFLSMLAGWINRQQQEAILRFLERKGISRSSYQKDIERFRRGSDATDFFLDIATAPDPAAFLKEKFGH